MAKKNDAKRAAKKHAKEKKRQKKLVARGGPPVDPIDRWKPAEHGVEGLARLLKTDSHHAAIIAELLVEEGKKGARDVWHPSRVRALDTAQLVAELATRGVATDEATFVDLAARYESARRLAAENWGPVMAPEATPHDRDLVGEAAEVLWQRWAPTLLSDERISDRHALLFTEWEEGTSDHVLDDFLDLWDSVRDVGGLARIDRAVGSRDGFVAQVLDAIEEYDHVDDGELAPLDEERAIRVLRELRAETPVGTEIWTGLALTTASLLSHAGELRAAIEDLLARAAEHPATPALPVEALELYKQLPDDVPGLVDRIEAAVRATAEAGPPKFKPMVEALLASLASDRAALPEQA